MPADHNAHSILGTAALTVDIWVPNLCDVIPEDVGGAAVIDAHPVADVAAASYSAWPRNREGEDRHAVSPVDPHDCFGRVCANHGRGSFDHGLPVRDRA